MCSAGSISVFACSWAALCYWWVGRFNTLNAIPRATELKNSSFSQHGFIWLGRKYPALFLWPANCSWQPQDTGQSWGRNTTVYPVCVSLLPPPGHTGADNSCAIISWQELTCFGFITYQFCTAELCRQIWAQHPNNQERKVSSGQESIIHAGSISKQTPKAAALRRRQVPNPNFGMTPPSLIPWSCILQGLALSGLGL